MSRPQRTIIYRPLPLVLLTLCLWFLLGTRPLSAQSAPPVPEPDGNLAGLLVDFGGGRVETRCVAFGEASVSGYQLLERSGLGFQVDASSGIGAAICQIGDTGCPGTDCFCQCKGGGACNYWSYWLLEGGNWNYSQAGASSTRVTHGQVQGWSWGPRNAQDARPPISSSFEQVCAAQLPATATPTPLPPTITPVPPTPTATATVMPPTNTAVPQISFTAVDSTLSRGNCTALKWTVQNVSAVYLDGAGVSGQGEHAICPAQTQTYRLRVVMGTDETTREVTVQVQEASATALFTTTATATAESVNRVAQVPVVPATDTAVADSASTPSITITVTASHTAVPTFTATPPATPTAVMILLPTVTPAEIAQLIPTNEPTAVSAPSTTNPAATMTPSQPNQLTNEPDWLSYMVFALMVSVLGAGLVLIRRE